MATHKISLISEGIIDWIRHLKSSKNSNKSFTIDTSEILGRLHKNALEAFEKKVGRHAIVINSAIGSPDSNPPKGITTPGDYTITVVQKYPNNSNKEDAPSGKALFSDAGDARKGLKAYMSVFAGKEFAEKLNYAELYKQKIEMDDGTHYGYILNFKITDSGKSVEFTPPAEASAVDKGKPVGKPVPSIPKNTKNNKTKSSDEDSTESEDDESKKASSEPSKTASPETKSSDDAKKNNSEPAKVDSTEKSTSGKTKLSATAKLKEYTKDEETFNKMVGSEAQYKALLNMLRAASTTGSLLPLNEATGKEVVTDLYKKYKKIPYKSLDKKEFFNDIKTALSSMDSTNDSPDSSSEKPKGDQNPIVDTSVDLNTLFDSEENVKKFLHDCKEKSKTTKIRTSGVATRTYFEKYLVPKVASSLNDKDGKLSKITFDSEEDHPEFLKKCIEIITGTIATAEEEKTIDFEWLEIDPKAEVEEFEKCKTIKEFTDKLGWFFSELLWLETSKAPVVNDETDDSEIGGPESKKQDFAKFLSDLNAKHKAYTIDPEKAQELAKEAGPKSRKKLDFLLKMLSYGEFKNRKGKLAKLDSLNNTALQATFNKFPKEFYDLLPDDLTKKIDKSVLTGDIKLEAIENTMKIRDTKSLCEAFVYSVSENRESIAKSMLSKIVECKLLNLLNEAGEEVASKYKREYDIENAENGVPGWKTKWMSSEPIPSEEFVIWEGDFEGKESYPIHSGYNYGSALHCIQTECDFDEYKYKIEYPKRKETYTKPTPSRKVTGADCLPNGTQRTLLNMIEGKFGITLDEKKYMASKGKTISFIKVQDKNKPNPEEVCSLDDWNEVQQLAYYKVTKENCNEEEIFEDNEKIEQIVKTIQSKVEK